MKFLFLIICACLLSLISLSQDVPSKDQVLDSLFKVFKNPTTNIKTINNLLGVPTDIIQVSTKTHTGYDKYSIYFLTSDGITYDYCLIPLDKLKLPIQNEDFVISRNLTMWDIMIKNGEPAAIEIYSKKNSDFHSDRLTLNYGYDSHEFLSVPLTPSQIMQIKSCVFLYKREKFTKEQKSRLKKILKKIRAEYAYIYSPFPDFDPPPPQIIKSQKYH